MFTLLWMRTLLVGGVIAASCVACGSSEGTGTTPVAGVTTSTVITAGPATTITTELDVIRVEIATGCPASVAGHQQSSNTAATWISNPDLTGLDGTFVPGTPASALVCRYTSVDASASGTESTVGAGALFTNTTLDAATASSLAATLNQIVPSSIMATCTPGNQGARYTAIVFAVAGRADVDLWLKDWINCPEVSNGVRTSGELINGVGSAFLALLDADVPPAPPL